MKIFSAQNACRTIGFYLCTFITLMIVSCEQKEDPASRPYPRLKTLPVEQTADGTIFTGEIFYNTSQITDHGFIWINTYEPSDRYKISLGPKSGTGTFSRIITTTLQKNGYYTVKAYVTTAQHTVYGTELSFTSTYGSLAPQILAVNPQRAFLGDTITIAGKYFNAARSKVWLDDIVTAVTAASDSTLRVVVPATLLKTSSIKIKVLTGNQSVVKENAFGLSLPVIHSFSPTTGGMGDRITIWGKNFHPIKEHNQVYVGDENILVKEMYPDRLIIELPISTYSGITPIRVNVLGQDKESSTSFEWISSQITDIQPRKVAYGDTVVITGNNLKSNYYDNILFIGGNIVTPLEYTSSAIKVIIPDGSATRNIDVNIVFAYHPVSVSAPFSLELLPHTVNKYTTSAKEGEYITIEGTNFSPVGYVNEVYLGETKAEIVEGTRRKLVVKVPSGLTGTHTLKVTLTGLTVEAGDFTILP